MYTVAINFKNESKLLFYAQSFDIDITAAPSRSHIHKYTYQDSNGNEAPIWLVAKQVAAIVVSPVAADGGMSIAAQ